MQLASQASELTVLPVLRIHSSFEILVCLGGMEPLIMKHRFWPTVTYFALVLQRYRTRGLVEILASGKG